MKICNCVYNWIKNTINKIKYVYNLLYKDDRLEKLLSEIEEERLSIIEFLSCHDPYNDHYCTIRKKVCNSCGILAWTKDEEHRYLTANAEHLRVFYQVNGCDIGFVLGRTDEELINEWRENSGEENTFGYMCISTDEYVKQAKIPCRFFEFGYRNNIPLLLDVYKTPIFLEDGKFKGTVGNAINISDKEADIVDLLEHYIKESIAIRLDNGKSDAVAAYLIKDTNKKFNKSFPR